MPFRLDLYRAPDGVGPMHTWPEEHRQPLGTRDALQAVVDRLFRPARWEVSVDLALALFDGDRPADPREVFLFGAPQDTLLSISVYGGPASVRALMTALNLNHCYAQASGVLYQPFATGDHWPGDAPR